MIRPWRWVLAPASPRPRVLKTWELFDGRGQQRAAVWMNSGNEYTWHTYDANGVGGENAEASDEHEAKRACIAAIVVQGWAPGGWTVQW